MKASDAIHATIALEYVYATLPKRVFAEFADPVVRAQWSPPPSDILIYDEANFHVGGRDMFRCGPKNNPCFRGETFYHVIVPDRQVISSETLDNNGRRLAVSLNTLELEECEGGTRLTMTVQIVSMAGAGMIEGFESGNRSALEKLSHYLMANP